MSRTKHPGQNKSSSEPSFLAQAHREYHEAMGAVMGLPVAAAVGYFLDSRWQTAPWCLVAGALLGAAATVVSLKELLQKLDKQSEQRRMQKLPSATAETLAVPATDTDPKKDKSS